MLDIKSGSGAFLQEFADGVALAESMIAAGENAGIHTVRMEAGLGEPAPDSARPMPLASAVLQLVFALSLSLSLSLSQRSR